MKINNCRKAVGCSLGRFAAPLVLAAKQHTEHRAEPQTRGREVNGRHPCRLGTIPFSVTGFGAAGSFWGAGMCACPLVSSRAAAAQQCSGSLSWGSA